MNVKLMMPSGESVSADFFTGLLRWRLGRVHLKYRSVVVAVVVIAVLLAHILGDCSCKHRQMRKDIALQPSEFIFGLLLLSSHRSCDPDRIIFRPQPNSENRCSQHAWC